MATVVFTMRDGATQVIEGVTLKDAVDVWWHVALRQNCDEPEMPVRGFGIDLRDVVRIEGRASDEEWTVFGPNIKDVGRSRLDG
jgi:hypothetical protein